jgi:hypothetical protein
MLRILQESEASDLDFVFENAHCEARSAFRALPDVGRFSQPPRTLPVLNIVRNLSLCCEEFEAINHCDKFPPSNVRISP